MFAISMFLVFALIPLLEGTLLYIVLRTHEIESNLIKKYNGMMILNNLTLTIQEGECVAVIGKSGCGKTTLLNIIGLLDAMYEGKLYIKGNDIKQLHHKQQADFIQKKH